MTKQERPIVVTVAAVSLLIASACAAASGSPPDFSVANFSYNNDPTKVILYVAVGGGMRANKRSMTLYGDGRLQLVEVHGGITGKSHESLLSTAEINRLLRIAVDHGLAEWDSTRIRARLLERSGGNNFSPPEDFPSVLVLLSIENYEREGYEAEHVEKELRFRGARFFAPHLPSVPEIAGIATLHDELNRLFEDLLVQE